MTDQTIVQPEAWEWHEFVMHHKRIIEENFLELGRGLYEIKAHRHYKAFQHKTFESYIADPDVDVTRSLAYRLIRIYELFQLTLECPSGGLLEAGHTKLDMIAPHVHSENVDELTSKAAALSKSDLRIELKDEFGDDAVIPLPCDHRRFAWLWKQYARKLYQENDRLNRKLDGWHKRLGIDE
jgi:hypothetical protein